MSIQHKIYPQNIYGQYTVCVVCVWTIVPVCVCMQTRFHVHVSVDPSISQAQCIWTVSFYECFKWIPEAAKWYTVCSQVPYSP